MDQAQLGLRFAASALYRMEILQVASGLAWLAILTLLAEPCWRILCRRPRYLDWLWASTTTKIAERRDAPRKESP